MGDGEADVMGDLVVKPCRLTLLVLTRSRAGVRARTDVPRLRLLLDSALARTPALLLDGSG
jgi:hypothetical protein